MKRKTVDESAKTNTIADMEACLAELDRNLLTASEAAAVIGVSRQRVHDFITHGLIDPNGNRIKIPSVMRGNRYVLHRQTVEMVAEITRAEKRLRGRPKKSSACA